MKKKYYYTSDAHETYHVVVSSHLAEAAGLQEIPQGSVLPPECDRFLNNPRYVWAKEAKPSSATTTKRVKLIVQADSPLYRTTGRQDITVNDVHYITTGRVGEAMTFSDDSKELLTELAKPQSAQSGYPARSIKCYSYTGDDGQEYLYQGAEYLALAAGLQETEHRAGIGYVGTSLNNPRYIWVKEAVSYTHGKTRRLQVVLSDNSHLYRTNDRHPVYINGILYISTGRVGECLTFWGNSESELKEMEQSRV